MRSFHGTGGAVKSIKFASVTSTKPSYEEPTNASSALVESLNIYHDTILIITSHSELILVPSVDNNTVFYQN